VAGPGAAPLAGYSAGVDTLVIDRPLAALIGASGLGCRDAFKLPLAPEIGLELGEHLDLKLTHIPRTAGADDLPE